MHVIENEFLRVTAREFGAELTSIFDKKNKLERLWKADKEVWGWHAPVLFPVVGVCLNDEITVDGVKYPMQKHGFARKSTFKLLELSDHKMVFSISDTAETMRSYPYKFEFLIGYRLKENELIVSYEVLNKDDKPIYFCIGGHPAFATQLNAGEKYEDYYIQFENKETSPRYLINENGLFDGRTAPVLNNTDQISLEPQIFKDDAYIFKDLSSRKATLKSKKNPHYLSMDFKGFNYLGLWAKTNAPYVCIEPWLGCADTAGKNTEFSQKEGVISLPEGEKHITSYQITVG